MKTTTKVTDLGGLNSLLESSTKRVVQEEGEDEFDAGAGDDPEALADQVDDDFLSAVLIMMAGQYHIDAAGSIAGGETASFFDDYDDQAVAEAMLWVAKAIMKSKGRFKAIARAVRRNPTLAARFAISYAKAGVKG